MSHGVLDSISHLMAAGFLTYRAVSTPLDNSVLVATAYQLKEHRLHVCGAMAAALANLNDTWQEAHGNERKELEVAYHTILQQVDEWRASHQLPAVSECQNVEIYRLNGMDAPHRRVNWSYRLLAKKED